MEIPAVVQLNTAEVQHKINITAVQEDTEAIIIRIRRSKDQVLPELLLEETEEQFLRQFLDRDNSVATTTQHR